MKNTKKRWALILVAVLALTFSLALFAACGGDEDEDDDTPPNTTVTTSYQFTGGYYEVKAQYAVFEFLIVLTSDNNGTLYQAEIKNGTAVSELDITWTSEEDRDGIVEMKMKIDNVSYSMYQENDGSFVFQYTFKFAGQYTREVELSASNTIAFATVAAWQADAEERNKDTEPVDPPDETDKDIDFAFFGGEVIETGSGGPVANCAAEVELYDDGTAYARRGYAMGEAIYATYNEAEGTWTNNGNGTLTIVLDGETYMAELEAGVYSFTWEMTHEGEAFTVLVSTSIAE